MRFFTPQAMVNTNGRVTVEEQNLHEGGVFSVTGKFTCSPL